MARSIEPWRFEASTLIFGAPNSPLRSTSQARCAMSALRAAARQVACAIWQPLTKAKEAEGRQSEEVFQPFADDFFDDGGGWAASIKNRVLIPCRGEPVGSQGGRKRAADAPGKESSSSGTDQAVLGVADQFLDHCLRIDACIIERLLEAGSEFCEGGGRGDRTLVQAFQVGERCRKGGVQSGREERIGGPVVDCIEMLLGGLSESCGQTIT